MVFVASCNFTSSLFLGIHKRRRNFFFAIKIFTKKLSRRRSQFFFEPGSISGQWLIWEARIFLMPLMLDYWRIRAHLILPNLISHREPVKSFLGSSGSQLARFNLSFFLFLLNGPKEFEAFLSAVRLRCFFDYGAIMRPSFYCKRGSKLTKWMNPF